MELNVTAMTEAELAAYSYTAAAGKRPGFSGMPKPWYWWGRPGHQSEDLPIAIFDRLESGQPGWKNLSQSYPTESAALAAADEAYRRARRDGWRPDGEVGVIREPNTREARLSWIKLFTALASIKQLSSDPDARALASAALSLNTDVADLPKYIEAMYPKREETSSPCSPETRTDGHPLAKSERDERTQSPSTQLESRP